MRSFILLFLLVVTTLASKAQTNSTGDAVMGTWKANEKVLTIQVYKKGQEYRAKIISFTDHHSNIPSEQRIDEHNLDSTKRGRKMIGMDVLTGLNYNADDKHWTDGQIYDAGSGKMYSATVDISDEGIMSVRAYKGISLLGKTLTFHR